jgi:hypothetical protein
MRPVHVHHWRSGAVHAAVAPGRIQGEALIHHDAACQGAVLHYSKATAGDRQPCAQWQQRANTAVSTMHNVRRSWLLVDIPGRGCCVSELHSH